VISSTVQLICGTLILLAVIAACAVLAWHGTISGSDAMVAITAIVGIGGGAFAVHSGVAAGAKAATTGTPSGSSAKP